MPTMPDTPRLEALGQRLRAARKRRGLRLRHVAQILRVAITTVHGWEAGATHIPALRLVEYADLLGLDLGPLGRSRVIRDRSAPHQAAA